MLGQESAARKKNLRDSCKEGTQALLKRKEKWILRAPRANMRLLVQLRSNEKLVHHSESL
jgi:hypothetical protein